MCQRSAQRAWVIGVHRCRQCGRTTDHWSKARSGEVLDRDEPGRRPVAVGLTSDGPRELLPAKAPLDGVSRDATGLGGRVDRQVRGHGLSSARRGDPCIRFWRADREPGERSSARAHPDRGAPGARAPAGAPDPARTRCIALHRGRGTPGRTSRRIAPALVRRPQGLHPAGADRGHGRAPSPLAPPPARDDPATVAGRGALRSTTLHLRCIRGGRQGPVRSPHRPLGSSCGRSAGPSGRLTGDSRSWPIKVPHSPVLWPD